MPANEYYDSTGIPAQGGLKLSAALRAEFNAIEAGFSKLPSLVGNGGKILEVNFGGDGFNTASPGHLLELEDIEIIANKNAADGYCGKIGHKLVLKNLLGTVTSTLGNANTAARTYTMQDRDGPLLTSADTALLAPLANPTLTGEPIVPTPVDTVTGNEIINGHWMNSVFATDNTYYVKINDNYAIQVGTISTPLANTQYLWTFTVPFTSTPNLIMAGFGLTGGTSFSRAAITTISATQIGGATGVANGKIHFIVFGPIAAS